MSGFDADGDARRLAARSGDLGQRLQLGSDSNVEAENALVKPSAISSRVLPTPEKMILSPHAGGAGAPELASGDDVHAGAEARQGRQNRWLELAFIA